ncbi:MAG TPA: ATP-binding protein [Bryobacteraceae bacterium]|nr:ATP-binding protein [Bryobacteraceae bacterium]
MRSFPRYQQFLIILGFSCIGLVAALLLRWTGDAVLPFFVAVFASAWFFGFEGGITAVVFTSVFALLMTVEQTARGWMQVAEVVALGVAVSYLLERAQTRTHRFRSMLGSIGDAVIAADRNGNISYMNEQAEALLATPLRAAKRRPLRDVVRFREHKTGEPADLPIEGILRGETPPAAAPRRLVLTREGPDSEVEEMIAPVRNRAGRIAGVIVTIRDTTRRREAEDQLSRSQKMDALARMAGGVAGDFNNLLTVITGYGEMLRGELPSSNPLRRFADEIIFAADRAAAVTRQLMAFSRHQSPQTRVLDLNASITSMETMLRRLLGERIEVVLIPGPGVLRIKADPGHVEQVIVNLAMNSRDAMPNGGKFMIETSQVELMADTPGRPGSLSPGSFVVLTVSDTGIGMDANTRSRLFEPFFTTKGQGKSTGLGLSIVYGIVKQSGGDISVYSQPGAGTIFEIYLPKSKEQEASMRRIPRGPRGTETILVADDDDGVRKLVHAVLATSGYTVVEAPDGKEALALYQADPARFDMVLTDIVMPHMNGFELGNRISDIDPAQKVLYMSGFRDTPLAGMEQERQRLFLHKPFTPDSLLARVREVLDGRIGTAA